MNELDKKKYNFHLEILKNDFELKKAKNKSYSLRQFAKRLEMSPSWLSDVLRHKKFISIPAAQSIANRLNLSGIDKKRFILCCLIGQTKNKKLLENALLEYSLLEREFSDFKLFDSSSLTAVEHWVQFAIMELITFSDFDHTTGWLAAKTKHPHDDIEKHVQNLITLGWVTFENDKYLPSFKYCESTHDTSSVNIKKYHEGILIKAKEVLKEHDISIREFQSSMLGLKMNPTNLKKAKAEIRAFVARFNKKFAVEDGKDQVFQLGIQFFKVT